MGLTGPSYSFSSHTCMLSAHNVERSKTTHFWSWKSCGEQECQGYDDVSSPCDISYASQRKGSKVRYV